MALIPISTLFEVLFAVFAMILTMRPYNLAKIVGIGLWTFEIPLLTLNQEFFTDASGVIAESNIAFPASILGYVIFGVVIVWIYLIYNAYAHVVDREEW